jgi:hypothetical protein
MVWHTAQRRRFDGGYNRTSERVNVDLDVVKERRGEKRVGEKRREKRIDGREERREDRREERRSARVDTPFARSRKE